MVKTHQDGLLLLDKPAGMTSHDVVIRARRALQTKKIGHCGTLDPDAVGLLVLTVGLATRLTRFLIRAPKVYEGTIRFGVVTDTYDASGQVVSEHPTADLNEAAIKRAMEGFLGAQLQSPPPYCAKKVGGVKYYELARRGEQVPDEKKEIVVYRFEILGGYEPGHDLRFVLSCASGTYARSLAHDLGQTLGCGGILSSLCRTQIGSLKLGDAIGLEALQQRMAAQEELGPAFISFDEIPLPFGEVITDVQQERRIHHGQSVLVRDLECREGDWIKLINHRRELIAVGAVIERIGTGNVGVVQPKVVFR
ncbi:MAG: tRNA pseudouridine(55) synthase TruB [Thermoanaerobaculia bacterium]|nr:tRNA pseudouridine(55) synthase TruB [Thermoanaerobaculia bacterium]